MTDRDAELDLTVLLRGQRAAKKPKSGTIRTDTFELADISKDPVLGPDGAPNPKTSNPLPVSEPEHAHARTRVRANTKTHTRTHARAHTRSHAAAPPPLSPSPVASLLSICQSLNLSISLRAPLFPLPSLRRCLSTLPARCLKRHAHTQSKTTKQKKREMAEKAAKRGLPSTDAAAGDPDKPPPRNVFSFLPGQVLVCACTRVLVCVCVAPKLPGHLLPVDLPSAALFDFWSCWPPLSPYIPRSLAPFLSVSL